MDTPIQLRGLSLLEPWATLMAIDAKRIETRGWGTSYRGSLAIQASKKLARDQKELCFDEPFRLALVSAGFGTPTDLPVGCVVAVRELLDCIEIPDGEPSQSRLFANESTLIRGVKLPPDGDEFSFGNYTPGRFAWITRLVHRFTRPIPCVGALGLWTIPGGVRAQIDQQLAEAA